MKIELCNRIVSFAHEGACIAGNGNVMRHCVCCCSDEKCEQCLQRGASYVLNYKTENFVDLVRGMTKVSRREILKGVPFLSDASVHLHIVHYLMRGLGKIQWHQGKGVDIILDCIGAPYLEKDLECLAMDGKVVYIGLMGGLTRCSHACMQFSASAWVTAASHGHKELIKMTEFLQTSALVLRSKQCCFKIT